jgi:hypothetical protein
MIDFLAGTVTFAYVISGFYFLRFWRRTSDRLFLNFAAAFALLALNQIVMSFLGDQDERTTFAFILRILAFVLILVAIVDKNTLGVRLSKQSKNK